MSGCGDGEEAAPSDSATTTDTVEDTASDEDVPADSAADAPGEAGSEVASSACETDSPAALAACVDVARIETDLAGIAQARPAGTAGNQAIRELCRSRLEELGFTVELHEYGTGVNVIGKRPGTDQPDHQVLLGAHYDSDSNCPGADDNGSGVAGLLEAARILSQVPHARTLTVACWDEEELGLRGSTAWVRRAVNQGERVVVNLNFEMIGYYSDEPNSQTLPDGFDILFGDAAEVVAQNQYRGDFIALIADEGAAAHVTTLEGFATSLGMPTVQAVIPGFALDIGELAQLRRSDHAPFWDERIPAIMITDTADFRNPNYHCAAGPDAVGDLDLARAALVVGATVGTAASALQAGPADEGSTGRPVACGLEGPACPAGERCNININGVEKWLPACFSAAEATVQKGGECTRKNNVVGDDTCAAGLFCAFWGVPKSTPQIRKCLPLCDADDDCEQSEVCVRGNPSSHTLGVCVPRCDPFADECAEGLSCRYWAQGFESGLPINTCLWTGDVPEGGACNPNTGRECQDGLACVSNPADGATGCRAFCDGDHPCSEGFTCMPDRSQPADGGAGFCQPAT